MSGGLEGEILIWLEVALGTALGTVLGTALGTAEGFSKSDCQPAWICLWGKPSSLSDFSGISHILCHIAPHNVTSMWNIFPLSYIILDCVSLGSLCCQEYGVSDYLSNIAGQVLERFIPLSLGVIFTLGHPPTMIGSHTHYHISGESCTCHHGSRQCNHRDIIKH